MIYQHPLAYLLGLEGLALLRGWAGDFDRDFVLARLAEVRRFVNDPVLVDHPGVDVARRDVAGRLRRVGTDLRRRPERPVRRRRARGRRHPRHAAGRRRARRRLRDRALPLRLVDRGHRVVGVDSSAEMLDVARTKVPDGDFHVGELDDLPVPDASVDLVVCALALSHVPDLAPVMAEFAWCDPAVTS